MRIKVSTQKLIDKIEEAKIARLAKYEAEKSEYEAKIGDYREDVVNTLEEALTQARKGEDVRDMRAWGTDSLSLPEKPYEPREPKLDEYDRDISMLEMSTEDEIQIGVKDRLAKYL